MRRKNSVFNTIKVRLVLILVVLFVLIAGAVGAVNTINIRNLYEESYTERLLLTNALMGSVVHGDEIEYFVNLLKNQDDDFKRRQVEFYHDREELFRLQQEDGSQERQQDILARLSAFHEQTFSLKNEAYWNTLRELKELKEISSSTYVYVMADTGLVSRNGEPLFTYVFDAEDDGEYSSPEMDGLGTSDTGNEAFTNVFLSKKQTEKAEHYKGDFGELYFVCVPILNQYGDVVAVLGTDLSLDDMNSAIASSTFLFNVIIIAVLIVSGILIYILLSHGIEMPLSSLTKTALAFAEGNLHTPISESALRQNTEIGTLAQAFRSTLDATTLYLNSVPESLFIMNRNYETYFRNEQFIKIFGEMQALEFMTALFPENAGAELEEWFRLGISNTTVRIGDLYFSVMLKEISLDNVSENSILVIANDITDLMNEKENAQAAAAAKSSFLSRMSHEMRTPMNAIIGMTKVAGDSDSISNIKHCISIIRASSEQLLSIINDVLDMSKIEAGKLELENVPMNLEKTLMKVCSIVTDSMEKKRQKLNVALGKGLKLHYIADDLRLSQVLTNLLSNAVKFTPENGTITLTVENAGHEGDRIALQFSVSDTGIGMSGEQVSRLFNAFEQADGSIARRFGGTGLGLAISQSIVEKMGGCISVKSELGVGTTFSFTVFFECASCQSTAIFDGIRPGDIRLLIIEADDDVRNRFVSIVDSFGIYADTAKNGEEALGFLDEAHKTSRAYDIIFLSYEVSGVNGISLLNQCSGRIDKNTVIIITTYLEWSRIEKHANENSITRYITKPIFQSSVLDMINGVVGERMKSLDIRKSPEDEMPDLSGVKILLVEDIEINREIFFAFVEGTNISIDIAENGIQAVEKFRKNPDLYSLIIMDIQMPEMDGYEATRTIRAMDGIPRAKHIPIVAMSANAFKEDVDRCLECGMNDHLAKPIDVKSLIEKLVQYSS